MHTFETLFMGRFRNKWRSHGSLSLNATNPQSFTLEELNTFIGEDILKIDPGLLLDYGPAAGLIELRTALKEALYPNLDTENLITTAGGKEAIYICMHALLEEGDEVISFTPTFEPLVKIAQDLRCDVQLLELGEEADWSLDMAVFESRICDTTKLVIINFPHNPTGALVDQDTLDRIVALCRKHDVWLFSDEVFRGLEHDPKQRLKPVAEMYDKGISIGVLSKSHGVPAIRVGWVACQTQSFLERALEVKSYLSICNGKISELAAVPVTRNSDAIFGKHRALLVKNLTTLNALKADHPQLKFSSPKAGCTVFASLDVDCTMFAETLIQQQNLMVIPGPAFVTTANAFRLGFSNFDYEARLQGFVKMVNEGTK